jgi:hypothetical protein
MIKFSIVDTDNGKPLGLTYYIPGYTSLPNDIQTEFADAIAKTLRE